ncbi:MAG TPA: FG-GAP-like repeat-containing protein [Methylomirabilota bacterium]
MERGRAADAAPLRFSLLILLFLFLGAPAAFAWSLSFGPSTGNRLAAGRGSFPRFQAFGIATEVPMRWVVMLGLDRLATGDRDGSVWILDASRGGLVVAARYGEVVNPEAPPAVVALGEDRAGLALVGRDGRLMLWSDGALRSYDVGAPLSQLTFPVPVRLTGQHWDDLLAVAIDGAVVLIGSLPSGPRIVSRVEARSLPDARITLADLDGDGMPEAVVLTDPTERHSHGLLGDRAEAASVTVIGITPFGLSMRGRFTLTTAVFEDLVPVLAPLAQGGRPVVLVARSTAPQGTVVSALGWRDGALVALAESPPADQGSRWIHVVGAADLSRDGSPEVVAVRHPHLGGVLTAYRRKGAALNVAAQIAGFASHAVGSRHEDQALIADLDGNGKPEVIVPRQARETLTSLELDGARFVERWSINLRAAIESNLLAADLDGDGLLDLVVADRRALYVFYSVR